MDLYKYVSERTVRGPCCCGQCADAVKDPELKQPEGHTADLIFFQMANNGADRETFEQMARDQYPHWFDGSGHSYLEMGGDMGDQGVALLTMGLGSLLGVWQLQTPAFLAQMIGDEGVMRMAGAGYITIKI